MARFCFLWTSGFWDCITLCVYGTRAMHAPAICNIDIVSPIHALRKLIARLKTSPLYSTNPCAESTPPPHLPLNEGEELTRPTSSLRRGWRALPTRPSVTHGAVPLPHPSVAHSAVSLEARRAKWGKREARRALCLSVAFGVGRKWGRRKL